MLKVHSFETLGALDGPGLRTVVFLAGCPMRCVYCHNPDMFFASSGVDISFDEILNFARRYKNYYGKDGGVTLSGGEPLMQKEGVIKLLDILKDDGIHTALDTSGCVFVPEALQKADIVLLDIKHTTKDGFLSVTGHSIDNTLKTLEYLQANKKRFWIRQVIVEGYTDSEEQIKALKSMAKGAEKIELLPYHSMGEKKWQASNLDYKLKGVKAPSGELMDRLKKLLN